MTDLASGPEAVDDAREWLKDVEASGYPGERVILLVAAMGNEGQVWSAEITESHYIGPLTLSDSRTYAPIPSCSQAAAGDAAPSFRPWPTRGVFPWRWRGVGAWKRHW
jgi:hypothetical protein